MSEVSKSLIVTFDALNLVKGIKSIGGPDKQVYYIESDVFAPDRRITPLILQPYLLVEDPHEIIPNGDKISELSSAKWYFDEIKSENRITAKEENASIDTPFALGANNSLHIRKNVEKAIQLFFEAEYLDIRKNKNIHISLTYLLTTTQSSEVKPAPKLKLSKPQSWKYCPLNRLVEATIEAEVFADNKGYKSAVEWCKVEGDVETPLSEKDAFYLGGQNSNKLVVNPDVMGDTLLRARNLSEEVYNKYYGINPEWDGHMDIDTLKSLDYRNLVVSSNDITLGNIWSRRGGVTAVNNLIECKIGGYFDVSQPFSSVKGHKYYGCYKIDNGYLHLSLSNKTWDSREDVITNLEPPLNDGSHYSDYIALSGICVASGNTKFISLVGYPSHEYYRSWNVHDLYMFDLTEKFGAGNEPTLEQCDEIFEQYGYIPAPEDLAKDGIIKGEYQSDIKFTRYFPEVNAEILFLTGDSIRPEHKTIKAQAIFTTNKEPIGNPSEFFDIEWFIDPIEAGGVPKQIGTGEFMEIAVSELPLKGGRLVPIRIKYNFK